VALNKKKNRYTPMEVAKQLGIPNSKFHQQISEGNLPKGRIGEDGRRYYTDKDVEFIRREWRSKTTAKFLLFTLPLVLICLLLIIAAFHEISDHFSEQAVQQTPTPQAGYATEPRIIWSKGTPWPTRPPMTTPKQQTYKYYRKYKRTQGKYRYYGGTNNDELIE